MSAELLTTTEVAERFGVNVATVRRWVQAKKIQPAEISFGGGYYRFDAGEIEALIAGQRKPKRSGKK